MSRRGRIYALYAIVILAWLGLIARLVYLQLMSHPEFISQARDNMLRQKAVPTSRGRIYDCRGRVLARNQANLVIKVVPIEMEEPTATLLRLAKILQLPAKKSAEFFQHAAQYPGDPLELKEALDERTLARVAELQGESEGIYIDVKSWRDYPLGAIGAHVLGYVGEISAKELAEKRSQGYSAGEWIGQDGLEYSQNSLLHGQAGRIITQVDVSGKEVRQVADIPGCPGSDIYLNIDARLQRQAEYYLQSTLDSIYYKNGERSGGAVVAIEPRTGFVRALVSLPGYNPNWFAKGISSKRFDKILNDKCFPLLDRAISGAYPPGSTFKLVTTSAALQEGVITPGTWFYCPGVYYVEGLPFNCFVRTGHGTIDLIECIAQSCDVAYYQMGTKLGLPRLLRYAREFGIGELTGVELPGETAGNFPYPGWKETVFEERWFPGDDANTAIGQGFVATTPLQLAVMTAAVANGGLVYRPQVISRIETTGPDGVTVQKMQPNLVRKVSVNPQYLSKIREGMEGTVSYGTASSRSYGIDMAGKTGTAENSPSTDNPHGRNHTWFTGFAPVYNPELVVTVFLEKSGGYGGSLAAPVAFNVVREWKSICNSRQSLPCKPVESW